MIQEVRNYFMRNYGFINLQAISDNQIKSFMNKPYILRIESFERKMDLLYDYILSQDLTDVEE